MGCASVTPVSAARAALAYAACIGLDPEGKATPESAASAGESFALKTDTGSLVYTIAPTPGGGCWVHAAAGQGAGMTEQGLRAIERQAQGLGLRAVAFQTMRRGLVRKAQALGYRVAGRVGCGVILEKYIR